MPFVHFIAFPLSTYHDTTNQESLVKDPNWKSFYDYIVCEWLAVSLDSKSYIETQIGKCVHTY